MAKILDGTAVSKKLREEIKEEVFDLTNADGTTITAGYRRPRNNICLAVVLCTDDPASRIYVERKRKACEEVGITSLKLEPFDGGVEKYNDPQEHLISLIGWLNKDPAIHGILVQLPLPNCIDQQKVFDRIHPWKDVDVFNPINVGLLMQGRPRFIPCTPHAVQELLYHSGHTIEGKSVCIINRSDVVGKPLSALLVQDDGTKSNATVKVCHDRTPPDVLSKECQNSDIIVVAVGKKDFLTPGMVGPDSVVVDVGINRVEGSRKIHGDCHPDVYDACQAYSPVPGGVGPFTVTMLLHNTVKAFKLLNNAKNLS